MPVNSVIGYPESRDTVRIGRDQTLEVKGYALPQGPDGPVVKIEVSVNDGVSWHEAELLKDREGDGRWTWVLWWARVELSAGRNRKILSRATDKGGNVQEKNPVWNLRGVAYNGYGEVRDLTVEID
jgi:sulfite oxidase